MLIPWISSWIPIRPLLIWTLVSVACGLVLVILAVMVAIRRRDTTRLLAVVPLLVSVVVWVIAFQIWTAYLFVACPYPHTFLPTHCFDLTLAANANDYYQPFGWAVLRTTVLLLVVSIFVQRRRRTAAG